MTVEQILAENRRRRELIDAPYDPLEGDSHDPTRSMVNLPGMKPVWVPATMLDDPEVKAILQRGAFTDESMTRFNRIRLRHDFAYWAASYAYIKVKGGGGDGNVLCTLNLPQRRLVAALEEMRRNNLPIRLILLKARQWGGSTCIQLYMAWLQLVHQCGLNSLIVSNLLSSTDEIKDMFDHLIQQYPRELLTDENGEEMKGPVTQRVGKSGTTVRIPARNCKVKVGSAGTPDGCRGGDYNLVHCSEVGLWRATKLRTPEMMVRSACSGVLLKPMTMIVYESTANGTENFFHKEYKAAVDGESQFTPLFIAWHQIPLYSLPFAAGEREKFAARLLADKDCGQTLSERRQPGKYLWWLWEQGATLEAIHWYVRERAKFSDHGLMASEYPSDDVEAFVHSGARVFDRYAVERLRVNCRPPVHRGEICGKVPSGPESLENLKFVEAENGGLAVWKFNTNEPGNALSDRYIVVVDIGGRSLKSDWSVIAVFDRGGMLCGRGPELVAQWRGHTDIDLLAWNAARIAKFYDDALLVIESNTLETSDPARAVDGDQSPFIFNQLRYAYSNLYARRRSQEAVKLGAPRKYGFHTNVVTKPMVISTLVQMIRDGSYIERDKECLAEYLTYEQHENGSYGALPGHHDDLLMTRAIGLHIAVFEMALPAPRLGSRPSLYQSIARNIYE